VFRINVLQDKIKTHILFSVNFCRKWFLLWDDVEKYSTVG